MWWSRTFSYKRNGIWTWNFCKATSFLLINNWSIYRTSISGPTGPEMLAFWQALKKTADAKTADGRTNGTPLYVYRYKKVGRSGN